MGNSETASIEWAQIAIEGFDALRARKWLIIIVTLVAAGTSAYREITTPSYGAETLVAVTPLTAKGDLIEAVPDLFEPKAYERLLLSSTVIGLVGERLAEEGYYAAAPPTVDQLRPSFVLNVDLLDQTTRPVTFSPILRLSARAATPDMAVAKLRAWTDVTIEVGNKLLSTKIDAASETLARQRIQFERTISDLSRQLRAERANWNLDVIRREIELAQHRLDLMEQARQEAEQNVEVARRQIEVVEAALQDEEPVRVYRRSPSDDAFFIAKDDSKDNDSLPEWVMITEEENTVYTTLKSSEHEYRAAEAETMAKLEQLAIQIETAKESLSALKSDLAEHEILQDGLRQEIAIAQTVYSDVAEASSFSDAARSLTQAGDSGERAIGLNVVSDRVFPEKYEGVFGSRLSVMIATLTAFILITTFVLLRDVGVPRLRVFLADHKAD